MINVIKNILSKYKTLKNILKFTDKKIKIIFYSEDKSYQKFSYPLVEFFSKKYPNQVLYVSSDLNDKIENLNINNLFIGKGLLMVFFFSIVKADFIFLTLTDLGNHSIKKNKNVNKYVYFNHSGSSTFRGYTNSSFDNYDIILCNGKYQVDEILFRENKKNLVKKNLILTGHFYFDDILKKINLNKNPDEILVAPTWSYKYENFINENFISIINELIKKNHKVTFRPHPEHYKRSEKILKIIYDKFILHENFRLDNNSENIRSMNNAKCLITDISDIAIEYMLVLNRPVLYLEFDNVKVHNKDYSEFKDFVPIEIKFKNEFGLIFSNNEIGNINHLVDSSIKNFDSKLNILNQFKNEYYFNFGKTIKEFEKIWEEEILNS